MLFTRRRRRSGSGGGAPGVSITDNFNRADNAASLGTTTTGAKVWSALSGTWGILSNQAYLASVTADAVAVISAGVSDCTISLTARTTAGGQGIVFRAVDVSNYWRAAFFGGNLYLQKKIADVFTDAAGSPMLLAAADGDVLQVVLAGPSITVKVNTVTKYAISDAQWQTATLHGLGQPGTGSNTYKYDDFSVTA